MNVDFSAVLVILTTASGLIWLFGVLFFVDKNNKDDNGELVLPAIVDFARSFFPIFFIVLILRSFIVEPFKIPSASMMPTLLIGDFILVNKYDYGIRLPVLNTKIIENKIMDDKVDKGVNYSYYITSVDNNGNESDNSESQSELF
ncbi:MAG: hypothetical protein KAR43_09785 [Deltaproteobacteria bacterium]|nr:hypothetical protein [Deltaproteobacteria bacterium]